MPERISIMGANSGLLAIVALIAAVSILITTGCDDQPDSQTRPDGQISREVSSGSARMSQPEESSKPPDTVPLAGSTTPERDDDGGLHSAADAVQEDIVDIETAVSTSTWATVEETLELGLYSASATPVHLAVKANGSQESVRCEWRGVARTLEQRDRAVRYWLGLSPDATLPDQGYLELLFTVVLDTLNPRYLETAKANFMAIARGGLSDEYLFLTCFADYTVSEYLLGNGPTQLMTAYDRMGEAHSYPLYVREHQAGTFGSDQLQSEGDYTDLLLEQVFEAENELIGRIGDSESILFLAPMGSHNAIAIEAWLVVAQWDLQTDENGVVHAVRYGTPTYNPEYSQPYTELVSRIATSTASDAFAGKRITDVDGLNQYYRDIGAYDDITPETAPALRSLHQCHR